MSGIEPSLPRDVDITEGALRGAGGRPCVLVRHPEGLEAIAAADAWKAAHPEVVAHRAPADTLVDRMDGRSSRVRLDLTKVLLAVRPNDGA